MRRLRHGRKAPLAVAAILAVPLFLSALMAVSLAVERPQVEHVVRRGRVRTVEHLPTSGVETRIWLLALIAPVALLLVGALARTTRHGIYVTAVAAIVAAFVVTSRLDNWTARHTARFPLGMDLVRDSSPSDTLAHGEWERSARDTSRNLAYWTVGIAGGAIAVSILLEARRRRRAALAPPASPAVHAPTTTRPG